MAEKNTDRFAFGENWRDFSTRLSREEYEAARQSLRDLVGDLTGKTFLDVGCGSGLFSAAASALGAAKVVGFDVDEQSVLTSRQLVEKVNEWDGAVKKNLIEFKTESILNPALDAGKFDVVYSWGVLHHTGNMYAAFDTAKELVDKQGTLAIAIYNKHFTSPIWKGVKYTYVKSPAAVKKIMVWLVLALKFCAALVLTRQNPLKRGRGMRYYNDIVDWVGGYPYEYASVDEVRAFFESRGFALRKLIPTKGFTGCNEFVFERVA